MTKSQEDFDSLDTAEQQELFSNFRFTINRCPHQGQMGHSKIFVQTLHLETNLI